MALLRPAELIDLWLFAFPQGRMRKVHVSPAGQGTWLRKVAGLEKKIRSSRVGRSCESSTNRCLARSCWSKLRAYLSMLPFKYHDWWR